MQKSNEKDSKKNKNNKDKESFSSKRKGKPLK